MATLKEKFSAALVTRGERLVKQTFRYDVYTRSAGGFYYVGRSGSLRFGRTVAGSVPCSDEFKSYLINPAGR